MKIPFFFDKKSKNTYWHLVFFSFFVFLMLEENAFAFV